MAKINLENVAGGYNLSAINNNFDLLENTINENLLSRAGVGSNPNEMKVPLDMNSNRIYNVPDPIEDHEAVNKGWLEDHVQGGPYQKNLRVNDVNIPALPDAAGRANKLLTFDAQGNPQVQFPASDSATQLRIDLSQEDGAELIGFKLDEVGSVIRTALNKFNDTASLKDFGAIGDGTLHPLSEKYPTIAAAQFAYPNVPITSLSHSLDWAALVQAVSIPGLSISAPAGTYYIDGRVDWLKAAVVLNGDGPGYIRSQFFAPLQATPCTRFLVNGTIPRRVETRALYRGSAGDANDDPISIAFNLQNDGIILNNLLVDIYCDYTDASPTNFGADVDVGIFIGSRLGIKLNKVFVRGYARKAAIWHDSTRGVNLPELYPEYPSTPGAGSDGCILNEVETIGGYFGYKLQGPEPKPGLLHFGFQYRRGAQISFTGQPSAGQTVTLGSDVYTFRTTAYNPDDVAIGGSVAATINNLISVFSQELNRLVPYDVLTLTPVGDVLQIYSTSVSATPIASTSGNLVVQQLNTATAATQTEVISDPARFYDSVTNALYDDGRDSLGASDAVRTSCVFYSIEHHSGQVITPQNLGLGAQADTCAGSVYISGLGGSAVIHRQFFIHCRFHSREPYNVVIRHGGRVRFVNCTHDGSPTGTYGPITTSDTKTALVDIYGYTDPGPNFSLNLNNNQVNTHFYKQGYNITARNQMDVWGLVRFGVKTKGSESAAIEGISGTSGNVDYRASNHQYPTVGRLRFNSAGGFELSTRPNGTGSIETLLFGNTNSINYYKAFIPNVDNGPTIGSASRRPTTIFAINGAINTSDENDKQDIANIDPRVLEAWAKVEYKQFRHKIKVANEGDKARTHHGVIAQRVEEAFRSVGLDPFEYGVLCKDPLIDEKTKQVTGYRYGIRYDEAHVLELALLRQRIEALEAK